MPIKEQAVDQQWYLKRDGRIEGPYARQVLARDVILGRLRPDDEVSFDGDLWRRMGSAPQLVLDFLVGVTEDPVARQRLIAACRWEEALERHLGPRQQGSSGRPDRHGTTALQHPQREGRRRRATATTSTLGRRFIAGLIASSILVGLLAIVYFYRPTPTEIVAEAPVTCAAFPSPGVNWSNCRLEGATFERANLIGAQLRSTNLGGAKLTGSQLVNADLSYATLSLANLQQADLRAATLTGASLRGADLSGANLAGANLSYADLSDANLSSAILDGVRLDNAVWIDGGHCAPGSVGECRVEAR